MNTKDWIEAKLLEYFYALEMYNNTSNQIDDIQYTIAGVHAIRTDAIKGVSESRDKKLLRMSEKITPLERKMLGYEKLFKSIYELLQLEKLDYIDYLLLEYIYRYKKTYDEVANLIGYTDKTVVFRKRNKILNQIQSLYEGK